ncbi:uncharacterized protein LOC114076508 [Solanum pennellii]|uniref:Uncharacterized protein LOC114076508 n=1 Tax=Solanum pennellii TaxID=28526 RepID=A0ABM1V6Q4_SOLPN|nr:uncharacterized protein LOC114076508 [Solanum pennellii]
MDDQHGSCSASRSRIDRFTDLQLSRFSATTSKPGPFCRKSFKEIKTSLKVRLQSLRRDFEILMMKSGESIASFLSRAMTIVSQMRSYGKKVTDQIIVEKVLRSLNPKFDHVVAAIEESKDLSVFFFDKLMGSLQSHEARINRSVEKNEEKAFQGRGEFRGGRGRGYGRGRGRNIGHMSSLPSLCAYKG